MFGYSNIRYSTFVVIKLLVGVWASNRKWPLLRALRKPGLTRGKSKENKKTGAEKRENRPNGGKSVRRASPKLREAIGLKSPYIPARMDEARWQPPAGFVNIEGQLQI